jgi:broad-specificity NMP kinase
MTDLDEGTQESGGPATENRPKIAVVGTCASGKSTLVAALRSHGFDAIAVAQEHSGVPELWNHANPDMVVYLDVGLHIVRERRSPTWSEVIYLAQRERLQNAWNAADIIIDTSSASPEQSVEAVKGAIRSKFGDGTEKH